MAGERRGLLLQIHLHPLVYGNPRGIVDSRFLVQNVFKVDVEEDALVVHEHVVPEKKSTRENIGEFLKNSKMCSKSMWKKPLLLYTSMVSLKKNNT
jgi:hypothetical protein